MIQRLLFLFFFFGIISSNVLAQKEKSSKMGQTTLQELKMNIYSKDSTANAFVLYEHGNTFINSSKTHYFRKDYYVRIKILNKNGFNQANFKIKYSNNDLVHNIEGITYNLVSDKIIKTKLHKRNIFVSELNPYNKFVTFTLPDLQEGSIIEYKISFSTNSYKIYNWTFQSDIPKIKSSLTSQFSGSSKLNLKLDGYLKLDKEEVKSNQRCGNFHSCSTIHYSIQDIPAFIEEAYISSSKNFISKVVFERKYSNAFTKKKNLNSWKYLDKKLQSIDVFGIQLKKQRFFKKEMDSKFFLEKNNLKKAKKIYYSLQQHFTWNGNHNLFYNNDVKKAFKNKSADNSAINLSVFNALKAANLKPKIAILSTRNNGFITKLYPAITAFNYLIVLVQIDGKDYFLDASDKFLQFGQTPFKTLNGDVRVLNFKKGSYWKSLKSEVKNNKKIKITLELDSIEVFKGNLTITNIGLEASNKRAKLKLTSNTKAIEDLESENIDLELLKYQAINLDDNEKPLIEKSKILLETAMNEEGTIKLNPFVVYRKNENPFKLNERQYPVNFGAPFSEAYTISIKIPKNYTVSNLPKSKGGKLPDNSGQYFMKVIKEKSTILIYFYYTINKSIFYNIEYAYLKEFYKQLIDTQNCYIIFNKK